MEGQHGILTPAGNDGHCIPTQVKAGPAVRMAKGRFPVGRTSVGKYVRRWRDGPECFFTVTPEWLIMGRLGGQHPGVLGTITEVYGQASLNSPSV